MRVNLSGKKQGEHNSCQTKPSFSDEESLGESQYYLGLENEDKK